MEQIKNRTDTIIFSLAQQQGVHEKHAARITGRMKELLRQTAAEGAVLLENNVLPYAEGTMISLFGRVQTDYFYTGYGSGGDVNAPYKVSLTQGLRNSPVLRLNEELADIYAKWCRSHPADHGDWGTWPRSHPEMPVSKELAERAARVSDEAVVVLGRSSGEDRENELAEGSYYLSREERAMLDQVCAHFSHPVVLLNIGCLMDLSWIQEYGERLGAVMVVWQGGMESGNAAADLLSGRSTPCGKLTDTVGKSYDCYPSASSFGKKEYNPYVEDIYVGYRWFETFRQTDVLYPFGYGLSYTAFCTELLRAEEGAEGFRFTVRIRNTGEKYAGRETVQIYLEKPCGRLGNPSRVLAAFSKTRVLAPGESTELTLLAARDCLASYDESGKTGIPSAYVTEKGIYRFYLGTDVRSAKEIYTYTEDTDRVVCRLSQAAAPEVPFDIVTVHEKEGRRSIVMETVQTRKYDLRSRILDNLPSSTEMTGDLGFTLKDVKEGRISMETFTAQLSLEELEAISRGAYVMNSPLGAKGNAGVLGGVLPSLQAKGVPPVTTTDGPSGIRLAAPCSLLPIGTLLACTWDTGLVTEIYKETGREMKERGSDVLLAPGMNIHRNPLCGRNFEYYSEDPFLTGKIAAAAVKGIQSAGAAACPKHFACNNQEYCRNTNDSRVSERALREIYLKGFEICIREAKPQTLMTSYNKINGVWGHYNYELCTTILRNEWGFEGCVMTDWWMQPSVSPEFPGLRDNAYRVRAQVDVLMPGSRPGEGDKTGQMPDGTLLETLDEEDGITLGELQRTASNVLRFAMVSAAMDRQESEKAK